jgi:hypothetical protein
VRDLHLLRALVTVVATDPSRVEQVGLDRMRREQLEDPIALEPVGEREERVRAGDPEELARFRGAPRRGPGGLAEHEVRRRLLLVELGYRGMMFSFRLRINR